MIVFSPKTFMSVKDESVE